MRIFSQAKSFDNKKILNVPRYCKKAKKRKNVENALIAHFTLHRFLIKFSIELKKKKRKKLIRPDRRKKGPKF